MIWDKYAADRKERCPWMTDAEWLTIPVTIRQTLVRVGIDQKEIRSIVVAKGAFGEPYVKRIDTEPSERVQ